MNNEAVVLSRTPHRMGLMLALVALTLALAIVNTINSSRWIGATFPGFFVMNNRVIASVSLPGWPASSNDIFQSAIVAVNGHPVADGNAVYSEVANAPRGRPITYQIVRDGRPQTLVARAMRFTDRDYVLVFVPYLASGFSLALIGILVWYSKPGNPASRALLIGGLCGGVFALTAADLYRPYWFFRLHVAAEALFPAALLFHLAAVFPADRMSGWRWRRAIILVPYLAAAGLALACERFLYQPARYTLIHNLSMDGAGLGGAALLAAVVWDFFTSRSALVRQRIRVVLLGLLCGFAFPGALMFYSGMSGGEVPVNYAGFTVILFPLSIGYAIVQHDLFEIDAFVKRSVYYLSLTAVIGAAYLLFLSLAELSVSSIAHARAFPLLFTLAVALLLNPLKEEVQHTVDRVFFRQRFNPKEMLETLSAQLASTLQLDEIANFVQRTIGATVGVAESAIFVRPANGADYERIHPVAAGGRLAPDHPLVAALGARRGRALSRYDAGFDWAWTASAHGEALGIPHLELLVPLILRTELIGLIALGPKESGRFFSNDDLTFLRALANQTAVSLANALAYREIQTLNAALERRVRERTEALSESNHELHQSLRRLEVAYSNLERSQEDLSRAERMATLGRLAAGIAHEINTPLGASMTSLKLLQDLVDEYQRAAIGAAGPEDHREIAHEMGRLVGATRDWLGKAGAHIRSLKLHTRSLQNSDERQFPAPPIIEDIRLLLAHRLREAQVSLTVINEAGEATLHGDPTKLAQALTNIITNAIDASPHGATIELRLREDRDALAITVRDHGVGIPADTLPKIFDEFYSTKPVGQGTGLGLAIARDMVSSFRGTIAVESVPGDGSMFTLRLPRNLAARSAAA